MFAQKFSHDGLEFSFIDHKPVNQTAQPVILIHGFSSNYVANWVSTGWVKILFDAGYRVVALDNRGHGLSSKIYDPAAYTPIKMASDVAALMDHLDISSAHILGYSMGARISSFLALSFPQRVASLVFGGLGMGMIDGMGDWAPIVSAMEAEDPSQIKNPLGALFRKFADTLHSDRKALACCIETSREIISAEKMASIKQPTLVAIGSDDFLAGSGKNLVEIMQNAIFFEILHKDHMSAVGDLSFKKRVLAFYHSYPIAL